MRDPYVHVERRVILTDALIRGIIAEVTGLALDAPKTVTTGCGRRRPYAMTSTSPESVTCLACREYAHREHTVWARTAEAAAELDVTTAERDMCIEQARTHRGLASEFSRLVEREQTE